MALQARRRPVVTGSEQLIGASGEIVSSQCQCPPKFVLLSDDLPAATPPILVSE